MSIKAWMDDDGKLVWNGPIRALEPWPVQLPEWYKPPKPTRWQRLRYRFGCALHRVRGWLKKTFRPKAWRRDQAQERQIVAILDIIETRDIY